MAALTFSVRQPDFVYEPGFLITNTGGLDPKPTIYVPFDADPSKLGYIAEGTEEPIFEGVISFPTDAETYESVRRYLLAGKQIIQIKMDEFEIDQTAVDNIKRMLDEQERQYHLLYEGSSETDGGDCGSRGKYSSITNGVF